MKFLIQNNPGINIAPLINTLKNSLSDSCEIGFFSDDVPIEQMVNNVRPDAVLYYDNLVSKIAPLLDKLRCKKIEHVVDTGTQSSDYEFSLTNMYHPNFFTARCNTFILQNALPQQRFISDISFVGPPSGKAVKYLNKYLSLDSKYELRIYGQNKYHNWRYCGSIEDPDIQNIFASSQCVPVFDNNGMYDSRVLDAIYCHCVPIVEHNPTLIESLGDLVNEITFTGKEEFHTLVDAVLADPKKYKNDIIPELRKSVIDNCTWYDICFDMFKSIGLKQSANVIKAMKGTHLR